MSLRTAERSERLLQDPQGAEKSEVGHRKLWAHPESIPMPLFSPSDSLPCCESSAEVARLSKMIEEHCNHVTFLETKLSRTTEERKKQESQDVERIKKLEGKNKFLKLIISKYEEQEANWKKLLYSLQNIPLQDILTTKPLYEELLETHEDKRSPQDAALILVLQKLFEFHTELEDFSQEREFDLRQCETKLSQAHEEIDRLTNELQHVNCAATNRDTQNTLQNESHKSLNHAIKILASQNESLASQNKALAADLEDLSNQFTKDRQEFSEKSQRFSFTTAAQIQGLEKEVERIALDQSRSDAALCSQKCEHEEKMAGLKDEIQRVNMINTSEKNIWSSILDERTNQLQNSVATCETDKQRLTQEVQRLRTELQQLESTTNSEKILLSQSIHQLNMKFEALSNQAMFDQQSLKQQICKLSQELQQLFTTSSAENKSLQNEVQKLLADLKSEKQTSSAVLRQFSSKMQDLTNNSSAQEAKLKEQLEKVTMEFHQLKKTATSEKNRMATQMQQMVLQMEKTTTLTACTMESLNNEIKVLSANASSEKRELQAEIEAIKMNNNWLKLEAQHAMTQLKQLASKRIPNYQYAVEDINKQEFEPTTTHGDVCHKAAFNGPYDRDENEPRHNLALVVLRLKEKTRKQIESIKNEAVKVAQEEMTLENLRKPLFLD